MYAGFSTIRVAHSQVALARFRAGFVNNLLLACQAQDIYGQGLRLSTGLVVFA